MKFACVAEYEKAPVLKENGFDFIELTVSPNLLPFEIDCAFELKQKKLLECGLPAGAKIMVFGSGAARKVPEGFQYQKARRQIKDFLAVCNSYCETYDLYIAIEPLNKSESNILNTFKEAAELQKEVNLPRIKLLVDAYHFAAESEPVENLQLAG